MHTLCIHSFMLFPFFFPIHSLFFCIATHWRQVIGTISQRFPYLSFPFWLQFSLKIFVILFHFYLPLFLLFSYHSTVKRKPIIGVHSSHLSKAKDCNHLFHNCYPWLYLHFVPMIFPICLSQFSLYLNLWQVFFFSLSPFFHFFSYHSKEKTHAEVNFNLFGYSYWYKSCSWLLTFEDFQNDWAFEWNLMFRHAHSIQLNSIFLESENVLQLINGIVWGRERQRGHWLVFSHYLNRCLEF